MRYFKGTLLKKILGKREIDMTQDDPQADPTQDDPQADPTQTLLKKRRIGTFEESSQRMTRKKYAAAFGFSEDLPEEEDSYVKETLLNKGRREISEEYSSDDSISKYEALLGSSGSEDSYVKEPSLKKGRREIYVEDSSDDSTEFDISHPPSSKNKYRTFELNGLSVLLVSSKVFDLASASMAVGLGSFDDPSDMGGLAHLLEHVLFLGSKKYPAPNEFKYFVHRNGGILQGITELDHSVFSMKIGSYQLGDALKGFADMFSYPLMDVELMEMELTTIDSEFEYSKYKDDARQEHLICHTASVLHCFHRFTWGNNESFSQCDRQSLHLAVKKLFQDYYRASNMKLVVTSPNDTLDDLEELVRLHFLNLNRTELKEGIRRTPIFQQTKEIWSSDVCYVLESIEDAQSIQLSWVLPPTQYQSSRPERLILNLLSQENEGSLSYILKCKGWVTKFTAACGNDSSFGRDDSNWSYGSTSAGQIFVLLSDLTDIGWEKRYELVACICQYISLLRPSGSLIEEYAQSLRMKYHALEYDHVDELSFAQVLAVNMLKAPATSALSVDYVYDFGDQAGFEEILKKSGPQNMRVDCLSKLFKDKDCQTVPYFQARYKVEAMPDLICPDDSSLCLPSPNEFMPSRFFSEIKRVSLLEEADDTTKFDICLDEVSRKLFYRKEESAFLFSASFNLYTNCGNDITAHMKTLVIIEMIKDDLSAILFKGGEAFINFSLTFEDNNILELRFDGFDERFKDFVSAIWKRMKSFIPNEKCFKIIMDKMQREFTSSDIVKQAYQLLSNVLLEDNISLDEKFKVLNSISFSDVEDFNFASEIRIVGVCSGNLSEEESKEILSIFEATGTFEIPNEQATKKVLNPGVPLQINKKPKSESETNSLAKVFFQMSCKEEDSGRESAFLVILKATIDMFLYRELRQKERLGYEINCGIHLAPGMRGFFVYVVSPIYQPAFLLERIYNFFGTFVEFLEGFDKECFQTYIRRALFLTKRWFLPEDSGIHHGLIHDVKYIDGRSKSVIKSMRKMKKDDFIRLYKNFFTKETCCSINICISAGGASDQASIKTTRKKLQVRLPCNGHKTTHSATQFLQAKGDTECSTYCRRCEETHHCAFFLFGL